MLSDCQPSQPAGVDLVEDDVRGLREAEIERVDKRGLLAVVACEVDVVRGLDERHALRDLERLAVADRRVEDGQRSRGDDDRDRSAVGVPAEASAGRDPVRLEDRRPRLDLDRRRFDLPAAIALATIGATVANDGAAATRGGATTASPSSLTFMVVLLLLDCLVVERQVRRSLFAPSLSRLRTSDNRGRRHEVRPYSPRMGEIPRPGTRRTAPRSRGDRSA